MESLETSAKSIIPDNKDLDVLIVGAGFSGTNLLYKLRNEGFNVKVYEAGGDFGGVWYWNCYPGARCDSDSQIYQFSQEELWKDFTWTERFSSQTEVKRYFKHVDEKLNLSKDIQFNTRVVAAAFNQSQNKWLVKTEDGATVRASHLILCLGYAAKSYTPTVPGLSSFKGKWYHPSKWPQEGVDLKSKRVAIIGTGSTGVQIIQEIGPVVDHLTVYQRTPNLALPMVQYSAQDNDKWRMPGNQKEIFKYLRTTVSGGNYKFQPRNALDDTPEERYALFDKLYRTGGMAFWMDTYQDLYSNKAANDTAYEFWVTKTRARITDPVKKDLLAPLDPPHPFGTKRPSLEQNYYEVLNMEHIDIVDVNKSPIMRITEKGIETEKEGVIEVDVIIFATGFDIGTGGMHTIDIKNGKGETLRDKWQTAGTKTYLGMATAGYPNMYFIFGPQAPTQFANGPPCVEIQTDWITNLLVNLRTGNIATIEAKKEAEEDWAKQVNDVWNMSLFVGAKSSYQGSNIPGKTIEPLNFIAGLPVYSKSIEECANKNYEGFLLS